MVTVTVSDPQNHGEGRNLHTSYRVDTDNSIKGLQGPAGSKQGTFSVRRRYSDFQWLYQRLLTESPGAVVPIIPHRRALSAEARVSEELIKERRANLETFIQAVVVHPELEACPSLAAFLRAEAGEAFDAQKKELETSNPNQDSNNIDSDYPETAGLTGSDSAPVGGKIRNALAKAAVAMSAMAGQVELERTEDENEIEEVQEYIDGLTAHVKALVTQSAVMVKSTDDHASSLRIVSQSIFNWAQTHQHRYCPGGTDTTVNTLGKISSSTSDVSTLANQKKELEAVKFEQALQDLSNSVQAIRIALKKRYNRSLTYTTRLKQIANRQAALGNLQKNNKINKVPQAQLDLAAAERDAHAALQNLNQTSQRVLREMDRVQPDLDADLTRLIKSYTEIQIEYNKKMMDAWNNLLPHVNSGGGGSVPTSTMPSAPPPSAPPAVAPEEMISMLNVDDTKNGVTETEDEEDKLL